MSESDSDDEWIDVDGYERLLVKDEAVAEEIRFRRKPWRSEKVLRHLYEDCGKSQQDIARAFDVTAMTVSNQMEANGISAREKGRRQHDGYGEPEAGQSSLDEFEYDPFEDDELSFTEALAVDAGVVDRDEYVD